MKLHRTYLFVGSTVDRRLASLVSYSPLPGQLNRQKNKQYKKKRNKWTDICFFRLGNTLVWCVFRPCAHPLLWNGYAVFFSFSNAFADFTVVSPMGWLMTQFPEASSPGLELIQHTSASCCSANILCPLLCQPDPHNFLQHEEWSLFEGWVQ